MAGGGEQAMPFYPAQFYHAQYLPLAIPFLLLFAGALALLLLLVQIQVLKYVYMRLGVSSGAALLLLFASLIGSAINIPIVSLGPEPMASGGYVSYFGMLYFVPEFEDAPDVILAVNVGGAVIPTLLSLYLLAKNRLWGRGLIAVACMTAICHVLARPVAGVGIALPIFVPPLAAALVGALVSWRDIAPLAYIGGSLGVLIGADLLNLDKIRGLGAPIASIGGAGTFDGIFVTGLLAVLLASLAGGDSANQRAAPNRR
jgi:uncharacterized membrane protein